MSDVESASSIDICAACGSRLFAIVVIFIFLVSFSSCSQEHQSVQFLLDWKMGSFYAPYVLADAEGDYRAEGLKVEFVEGQGAETSAKLIGQGRYKLGTCNASATATAVDNGVPIVSVAMIEQQPVTAVFSLKKANIVEPRQLIGKTLGVRYYDISHKEYLAMMKAQNLSPDKVKEVGVGFDLQPLIVGQVDALYNYAYNMPVQMQARGYPINEILVKDWGVKGYGSNIIANRDFSRRSPDTIRRFLRASRKGWEAAIAEPARAVDAMVKRYPGLDRSIAVASLKEQMRWLSPGSIKLFSQDESHWREALSTYKELKMIKSNVAPGEVYSNAFVE